MPLKLNVFPESPTVRVRFLPPIDSELLPRFEKLARDLDVVDRARAEGVENRPSKDDRDLDKAQRDVQIAVREGAAALSQFGQNLMHHAEEQIEKRRPAPLDPKIPILEARAAVREAKLTNTDHLSALSRQVYRKRRQLNKFRADNGPLPDASYAPHWIIPVSILCMMTAAEMGANATLFAKANPLGLAGGAFQALLFGIVNVALGFCAGFLGLRFSTHVRPLYRALGIALLLITVTAGTYWNLKVARFRDLLEHNANAEFINPSAVVPALDWLSLSTIESWALLIFGILVFVLAMLEGRGGRSCFVDCYPGYRAVDLACREAEADYVSLKDEYRAAVSAAINDARANLRRQLTDDGVRVAEAVEISDAALVRAHEVRDSISEWNAAGCALLRLYREENSRIRTEPSPQYFQVFPKLDQIVDHLPDSLNVQRLANEVTRRHGENTTTFAQADAELAQLATEEIDWFLNEIDAIEQRTVKADSEPADPDHPPHNTTLTQIRRAS